MKAGAAGVLGAVLGALATFLLMVLLAERADERRQSAQRMLVPTESAAALPRTVERESATPRPLSMQASVEEPAAGAAAVDGRVGLLVYGALIEPSGAPVKSSLMGLRFISAAGVQRSVRPNDDGTYAVTGLQPGTWTVTGGAIGYRPAFSTLELEASRPVTRHDIVVERAVRLVVSAFTPDGQPLMETLREQAGAKQRHWTLRLSALASVEPLGALRTQFDRAWDSYGVGTFHDRFESMGEMELLTAALPPGALGVLDLSVPLPVHVTLVMRNAVLASQRVEPGQNEIVFRVALDAVAAAYASLGARFVDSQTGAPLEGVSLEMSDLQQGGTPQGLSDASGFIRCEKLLPGGLRFEAEREGYERLLATVTVTAGQHLDLGDVPLSPSTSISGVVRDESGAPMVANLQLSAVGANSPVSFDYSSWNWQSEADGSFRIERLGRRRYVLRLADDGRTCTPIFVDASAGDVTGVVVVAERGQQLSVYLAWDPQRQLGMRVRSTSDLTWTDWDGWSGQYVWKDLLPRGSYVAECYEGAQVLQSLPFEVDDAPVQLTLSGN